MTIGFSFASNPQNSQNPGNEKIAQMKKEQEAKRAELLEIVNEYREAYKASEKECAEKQSIFLMEQRELARHDKEDKDYDKFEKAFNKSKKDYRSASSDKDLRLSLLQFRTDNYTKANRINLLDLA